MLGHGLVGLAELGKTEGNSSANGFGAVENGIAGDKEDGATGGGFVGSEMGAEGMDGK